MCCNIFAAVGFNLGRPPDDIPGTSRVHFGRRLRAQSEPRPERLRQNHRLRVQNFRQVARQSCEILRVHGRLAKGKRPVRRLRIRR